MLLLIFVACNTKSDPSNVITDDIDRFWDAYDLITQESDSVTQIRILDSVYIQPGTVGLRKIMEVRDYSASEYVQLINQYPLFWKAIRENTLKSKRIANELNDGINKLKQLYPELRPASIYFTIGCMRTNGTTQDSLVLIGSELAMADSLIDISEFEGGTKDWLETYFSTNPINGLVLLNVHEYVHTQQQPYFDQLLYKVLYEGVAEFVSVLAMDQPSLAPAIEFGKNNPKVREKFEEEMFYERAYEWIWSSYPNEFGVRDLGYYIGYAIAERHYNQASDKQKAIRELIELDYSNTALVDGFIDQTGFFTKSISQLRKEDQSRRPSVGEIKEFKNRDTSVDPNLKEMTVVFSEQLNGYNTGVNYSDMGEEAFPEITGVTWSSDSMSCTFQLGLQPDKTYKFWITSNFRTKEGIPINPYLVQFKTNN